MSDPLDWLASVGGIINGVVSDTAHGQINVGGVNVEDAHGRTAFDAQALLQQRGVYCSLQPLGDTLGFLSLSRRDRDKAVKILSAEGYTAWVTPL